ncbi:hypothetical protein EUX98_g3278 [Antrodiella citrinella]|uniref:Uncharacterized protein n=1 Tax=Antrodiella citrinella TaxID=2447956 RepID=A0A4S4MWY0_9APHY|nr:hypothetical protein EUX98_g3278 [Antrodiella citrinella]
MTLHAPPDYPRSPTSPRLSPAAVPPISPRPSPPAPRPVTPAATPSPQPHAGFLRGIRDSLRNNVYVIAMLNEIGVARGRKPRNEIIAEDLKPVEGLQVTVLVAMPSQERKLAAKLKRESTAAEGGRTSQSESGEVKEVINPADDPSEISAEFGELVIGTMKVPWEEKKLEDVD